MVFVVGVTVISNAKTPWIILVCKQALYLGDVVESHARATRKRRWSPLEIERLLSGKTTFNQPLSLTIIYWINNEKNKTSRALILPASVHENRIVFHLWESIFVKHTCVQEKRDA